MLGVEEAINYRRLDLGRYRGAFAVVLETAGNLSPRQWSALLGTGGVALHVSVSPPKLPRVLLTPRNKVVTPRTTSALLEKIGEAAARGHLRLPVTRTVPSEAAIPALTEPEKNGTPKRKMVVVPA